MLAVRRRFDRERVAALRLVVWGGLERQRTCAADVERSGVRPLDRPDDRVALRVGRRVGLDRSRAVLGEARSGRTTCDRRSLVNVAHAHRDRLGRVLLTDAGLDRHRVTALRLIVRRRLQTERAGDQREHVPVRALERPGDAAAVRVLRRVSGQRQGGRVLGDAQCVGASQAQRLGLVVHRDRHRQRRELPVRRRLHRQLVLVVRVGVRRQLIVRRRNETQDPAAADAEVARIRPLERPNDRVALGVGGRVRGHRRRAVLGVAVAGAAGRDRRSLVHVAHRHGHGLRRVLAVGARLDRDRVAALGLMVGRSLERQRARAADLERGGVGALDRPADHVAFGICRRVRGDRAGAVLGEARSGRATCDCRSFVHVAHCHRDVLGVMLAVGARLDGERVAALGLVIRGRLERQRARGTDDERSGVNALDRPTDRVVLRVGGRVGLDRARSVLGEARTGRALGDRRAFIHVAHTDGDRLRPVLAVGCRLDRDRVAALRFVVRSRLERQRARAADVERGAVRPLNRPGDGVVLRVSRRVRRDRAGAVLGEARTGRALRDRWSLVHVAHRHRDVLGGVLAVRCRLDRERVTALRLVVWGRLERQSARAADLERGGISAFDRPDDRVVLGIGGDVGLHRSGPVLGKARTGRTSGDRRTLVDVGHGHGHGLGGVLAVRCRLDRDRVAALCLVVGRCLERQRAGTADLERGGVGALDRPGDGVVLRVGRRVRRDRASAVLGEAGSGRATCDRRSLVHVAHRHGDGLGVVLAVRCRLDGDRVTALGLVVRSRLERQRARAADIERSGVDALDGPDDRVVLGVGRYVGLDRSRAVLGEARTGRTSGDRRTLVHVAHTDGDRLRPVLAVGCRLDGDRVAALRFVVRRGLERQRARAADLERGRIRPLDRPTNRVALGVRRRVGLDRARAVLGEARSGRALGDRRGLVHVAHRDRDRLRRLLLAGAGLDGHRVRALRFIVRCCLQRQHAGGQREHVLVCALQRPDDGAALRILCRVCRQRQRARVLLNAHRPGAAQRQRLGVVGHRDRDRQGRALAVGGRLDRHFVFIVGVGVRRRLVVRRRGEAQRSVCADAEVAGIVTLQRPLDLVALRVGGRVGSDRRGAVLGVVVAGAALRDRRALVHVVDRDRDVERGGVVVVVRGRDRDRVGTLRLVIGRRVEREHAIREAEAGRVRAAQGQGWGRALRVLGRVRGHFVGGVFLEVDGRLPRDRGSLIHISDVQRYDHIGALAARRGLDGHRVGGLRLVVRRGVEAERARAADTEGVLVRAQQRPADALAVRVGRRVRRQRQGGRVLRDAQRPRAGQGDLSGFDDVGGGDLHVVLDALAVGRTAQGQLVDVVSVGIGRRFVIQRNVDIEEFSQVVVFLIMVVLRVEEVGVRSLKRHIDVVALRVHELERGERTPEVLRPTEGRGT